ncbi:histidine phosphatase family protein [Lacihabitans sp. LS3-19]|uniref:histidine phosphatase family protein n=1 Tax=Lacihabitans sp. LS3-19 TaxID=2487335 RepID=UPI0020CB759F|nr:histidine phosphatase family protein [Lacihabitans sp. LS3-19]MCP9770039.1 histidine phosphatase family protein [Lacihabitans sp. LS3-19]
MSKKEIYLIRHGETEYNKRGIVQGSGIDADLNETGRRQAEAFYNHYKDVPFQKIYTSALIRTHQTVEKFIKMGLPHEIIPELNEISWGEKEGLIPNSEDNAYYAGLLQKWREGETNLQAIGGESPVEVAERQKVAIKRILDNADEKLILIAMHGRAMRILLSQITNLPLTEMDSFPHQNTCLYKLEYCYTKNEFEILSQNDVSHLELLESL